MTNSQYVNEHPKVKQKDIINHSTTRQPKGLFFDQHLEKASPACSLEVAQNLRRFRVQLTREQFLSAKQITLDNYFKK
jgi:hypothetical protein